MKKQPEPVTRDNIVSILSDEEAAHVTAGTPVHVLLGDEYIDLADIDKGVQRAADAERRRDVLLKKSVAENTWRKIVTNLTARRLMAQPPPPPPPRH